MLWSGCKQDMLQNSNLFGNSSMRLYGLYSLGCDFYLVYSSLFFFLKEFFYERFYSLGMRATCPK